MLPAMLYLVDEIEGHLLNRLHQDGLVLDAELEYLVNPFDEPVAVGFRNAEHVRNGADRNVLAVAAGDVASPILDELVDQLVADGTNARFQLLDRVGRERRQQQLLCWFVLRRIGRDRW